MGSGAGATVMRVLGRRVSICMVSSHGMGVFMPARNAHTGVPGWLATVRFHHPEDSQMVLGPAYAVEVEGKPRIARRPPRARGRPAASVSVKCGASFRPKGASYCLLQQLCL